MISKNKILAICFAVILPFSASASDKLSEADKASKIYEDYFELSLKMNPINATFLGDPRYNDKLPNFLSESYLAKQLSIEKDYLKKIKQVDASKLSGQDLLSYQVFLRERKVAIEGDKFPGHLIPINQFYNITNFVAMLGSGQSAQPFKTMKDYENWLKRMEKFPRLADQIITNMKEGMKKGIVQPKVLMERVLPQIKAHVVDGVQDSLFYKPVTNMPESFSSNEKEWVTKNYEKAISEIIVPNYKKLHQFIEKQYIPKSRDTVGLGQLPGGKAWYDFQIKNNTTTSLTAEQVHKIGLDEVARIHKEMNGVMKEVGFKGSLKEFFDYTKKESKFYYTEREQLLKAYRDFQSTVDVLTPKLFEVFPKAGYEVRAVEAFREKSASGASYQSATPDGSRPGIFYVNAYDLSARPSWAVESLFLHEAAPGHHFQISIQQELDGIPKFRRFGGETAYVEGWGLYSESLGKELGVYQDPYQYFGALAAELWRAIRLVVDTGLHAKGWTRQQVLDYMYANAPVAEARAVSEAERFMAIPGQALAYKIGQLKIRQLRNKAERILGKNFNVKKFHTEVLKDGALPLPILEKKIDMWIKSI